MRSSVLSLALVASAACADVKIIWSHDKTSRNTSISVFDDTKLIARSCSSLLSTHDEVIDFTDVDDNGFGNFTIGEANYLAHSVPAHSGGPVCTKKYNAQVAVVECSGITWSPSDTEADENCHDDADIQEHIRFFTSTDRVLANETSIGKRIPLKRDLRHRDSRKREPTLPIDACHYLTKTSLQGDGNPHQNYYDKQLSQVINCGASTSCAVGQSESKSFSVGWSSDIGADGWISGGFSVQEEWSTGSEYTCYGTQGESVCVWYNTAHTAYTVANYEDYTCNAGWYKASDNFVMYSPNQSNRNGGYYCVVGTCRAQGDAYWDKSGRAGGP